MKTDLRPRGLNALWLKIIAITSMICDHFCAAFITSEPHLMRVIGRLAFPIFAFQIAEGAKKTHNTLKYVLRLLIFAVVSEIPFDLVFSGKAFDWSYQNVFFTLLFGLIAVSVIRYCETADKFPLFVRIVVCCVCVLGCCTACYYLKTDYSWMGVLSVLNFYYADKLKCLTWAHKTALVAGCLVTGVGFVPTGGFFRYNIMQIFSAGAVPIIALYNGEKGRLVNKYLFYAIYPVHLILFAIVKTCFFR